LTQKEKAAKVESIGPTELGFQNLTEQSDDIIENNEVEVVSHIASQDHSSGSYVVESEQGGVLTDGHPSVTGPVTGVMIGSSLEQESMLSLQAEEGHEKATAPIADSSRATRGKQAKIEKKDLIFSAGTIRSRYRDVRKEEESRLQKKHDRTMQKHSQALIRESLGLPHEQGDILLSSSRPPAQARPSGKKGTRGTGGAGKKAPTGKGKSVHATSRNRQDKLKKCTEESVGLSSLAGEDSVAETQVHADSCFRAPLQQSEAVLNSVINVDTAEDSIEELIFKYYEHDDFKEKVDAEYSAEGGGGDHQEGENDEMEEVILTESVPFTDYPANTCIIDGLVYSKFCMDAIYKGDIILIAKKALQQRQHVLLRSPLHFFAHDQVPTTQNPNSKYCIPGIDNMSDSDRLRECKQILKSIFMTCVAFSSEPIPPDIIERTTIEKLVTRRKSKGKDMGRPPPIHEDEFMNGQSLSEFVELEMLIPPKAL